MPGQSHLFPCDMSQICTDINDEFLNFLILILKAASWEKMSLGSFGFWTRSNKNQAVQQQQKLIFSL